jgi:hypothetical protein
MSGVRLFAGCYERFVVGQRLTTSDPPMLISVRSRARSRAIASCAVRRWRCREEADACTDT